MMAAEDSGAVVMGAPRASKPSSRPRGIIAGMRARSGFSRSRSTSRWLRRNPRAGGNSPGSSRLPAAVFPALDPAAAQQPCRRRRRPPAGPARSAPGEASVPPVNRASNRGRRPSGVTTAGARPRWARHCTRAAKGSAGSAARASGPRRPPVSSPAPPREGRPRRDASAASIRTHRAGLPVAMPSPCRWPTVNCSMPACRPSTRPVGVHDLAGPRAAEPGGHQPGMLARRHEADLLAVGLVGRDQAEGRGPAADLGLPQAAHRQEHPAAGGRDRMSKST